MSLFTVKDIPEHTLTDKVTSGKVATDGAQVDTAVLGKSFERVEQVIGQLPAHGSIHYASAGEWSTHELLYHLLQQTGPAKVYIATWSMTETPARWLGEMLTRGMMEQLELVLAFRTKNHHPGAYHLAKQLAARVRLTVLHAKVTVIESPSHSVSIVGSANYTNNPRIEAGVITVDKQVADFHRTWIMQLLEKGDPFETDK